MAPFLKSYFVDLGYGWEWTYYSKHVLLQTPVYLAVLFFLCMVCHGELVRRKPHARSLTSFYLSVAAGGALGGIFVAVVCPQVFSTFFELNLAIVLGFVMALAALVVEARQRWLPKATRLLRSMLVLTVVVVSLIVIGTQLTLRDLDEALERARNFYGVLSIKERTPEDPEVGGLAMYHGDTLHGFQLLADDKQDNPTSYYTEHSGVGRTFRHVREGSPLRVGAIGLGAGTVAAYARQGDYFRFYEINPLVIELTDHHFTFVQAARERGAQIDMIEGDARLSLELEDPQDFDVLVLDAFSGDSIPVHLLTHEAFAVYVRHVKSDGVIAVHTSNRYLDLIPVVLRVAKAYDLENVVVHSKRTNQLAVAPSDWIVLTKNERLLEKDEFRTRFEDEKVGRISVDATVPLWTDKYNNLFQTIF